MFMVICNILYYIGLVVAGIAIVATIVKETNIIEYEYNRKQIMIEQGTLIIK